jgi:hypothetical protein
MTATDAASTNWANACTTTALTTSVLNTWVHLAGVYDAVTRKLALYVDGTRVDPGTATVAGRWNATGPFAVGRARWTPVGGSPSNVDHWVGALDEVRVFQGVLSPSAINTLAHS